MDLETAAALFESDEIGPESLPGIAADALEEGQDSRALRLLAGIAPFDPLEARDLFHQAMVELGISTQPDEAAMIAARWVARLCLDGSLSPQDACARIWRLYLRWYDDHPRPEELQTLGEVGQFAEYLEVPEIVPAYGGRDQMERDAIAMLSRLALGEDLPAESAARRTDVAPAHVLSHPYGSDRSAAISRRPDAGHLRPAFVWALAILVVPMVILFGFGFYNDDIDSPWPLVVIPAYAVGALVAPVIFVRNTLRIGLPRTNAIAGGLAIASIALFADLMLFFSAGEGVYGTALVVAVAGVAMAFAVRWRPSVPLPPLHPDLVPPRPDL